MQANLILTDAQAKDFILYPGIVGKHWKVYELANNKMNTYIYIFILINIYSYILVTHTHTHTRIGLCSFGG